MTAPRTQPTVAESCNNGLQSLRQLPISLSRQPPAHGHEAIGSMDYDSTNNVFFHISDCELVEASQLVEELECSYWSDVELVSASQNAEDSSKVSGEK